MMDRSFRSLSMTANGLCKSLRAFLLGIAFVSCASTQTTAAIDPASLNVTTHVNPQQTADGSVVVATLTLPPELRGQTVNGEFMGTPVYFFEAPALGAGVYEAVFGVPYGQKPGPADLQVMLGDGSELKNLKITLAVVEGGYGSEVLRVDGRRVNPHRKKDLERIKREQHEVAEIYGQVTRQKLWTGPFLLPINSSITSPFGMKRIYNGALKNFHPGLDLKAPVGTVIRAAAPGRVVMSKNLFYTGNTIMLDHGYGIYTLYAHMSRLGVKKGQVVQKGASLGLSGMTGRVSGPHLHWQAVINRVKVNPLDLTKVMR